MSTQPKALYLARMIELGDDAYGGQTAECLRSQHQLIGELVEALKYAQCALKDADSYPRTVHLVDAAISKAAAIQAPGAGHQQTTEGQQ